MDPKVQEIVQDMVDLYPWMPEHEVLLQRLSCLLDSIEAIKEIENVEGKSLNSIKTKAMISTKVEVLYKALFSYKPKEQEQEKPKEEEGEDVFEEH